MVFWQHRHRDAGCCHPSDCPLPLLLVVLFHSACKCKLPTKASLRLLNSLLPSFFSRHHSASAASTRLDSTSFFITFAASRHSSFVHRSSFFVVRRSSSFVVRRSSFVIERTSFGSLAGSSTFAHSERTHSAQQCGPTASQSFSQFTHSQWLTD